ncbi:sulfate/molybdate ABC transporter ATP-binding protein [Pimelobacter simplex]|uniref:sulfate/molybdate ABC transporter ATP-binding protein n=1 Tax=Nocardioides simplex TaxID=2045 RepID=UPI00214F64D1|nr:ATP-binding cassette domain-containing protein [Pimelobacter simplex]UUW92549.1 ATP-binding cassette domain-containing protein [Pimelobacter simplex]UUW96376.1 ATP-binding cassette domain-containing protein [Pimelobacter simplex]
MTFDFSAVVEERRVEVTFTVEPGETLAVLGPNGAGKSTLLAVAAGHLRPGQGRVVLDGRPLTVVGNGARPAWVAPHDRQIALLAQDPLLFPHMSVRDNVEFAPRSRGVRRSEAHDVARHWLEQVGVPDLADRKPSQISGGQAQRVAVARALAADPRLLLLDEPMAALDVAVAPALRQTLRRVLADRSVVLVTHDALDALLLADTVIILDSGRIVEQGPATEVFARPRSAFAARIAGLNMLIGTWHTDGVRTSAGTDVHGVVAGPRPADGEAAVAIFPPAAVAIFREPPGGSPRNALAATITEIEPLGDRIRVRAAELSADVTAQAVAELDLVPGSEVTFTVKANEVSVYRI